MLLSHWIDHGRVLRLPYWVSSSCDISIKVCVCVCVGGCVRARAGTPDLYLLACVNVHRYVHMYTYE